METEPLDEDIPNTVIEGHAKCSGRKINDFWIKIIWHEPQGPHGVFV